jgi:rhomboid family GlyGly-CTERM serine protease
MLRRCKTKLACCVSKSVLTKIVNVIFYPALFLLALVLLQNNMPFFIFDREAISQGEWWRLLSAHFTHSSTSHAFWDVLAFTGVTFWLSQYSIKQMIVSVFMGIAAVDILLLSAFSSLDYYCGLSGILFSPLLLICYHFLKTNSGVVGVLPLLVVCTKILWEVYFQNTLFVDTGWPAYPEAHLAGLVGGLFCMAFDSPRARKK